MKKRLFTSLLLLSIGLFACHRASAVDVGAPYVDAGLTNLQSKDLINANSNFEYAASVEPTYAPANFLVAVTRVLLLEQAPAGSNFLTGLGVPALGRDYYDWTAHPETNSEGKPEFPKGYNSGTAISFYTNTLMPVISASLTNLANITDPTFQLFLPGAVTGGGAYQFQDVTVDYGDVQVLRSLLTAAQFFGYSLSANNADADMSWIETNIQAKTITFQSLLSQFPSLGSKQNTAALAPSEQAATNAIELYFGAANFILNDRTNTDALFNLSTNDIPQEIEFQSDLTNILLALTTPTQFNSNNVGSTIYLAPYFNGDVSFRSLVPKFNGDAYVPDSMPDYTFGGILPDQPSYETESLLLKKFPNYAGIYIGDNGLYDVNLGGYGNFAAYISTNGQLTVIGWDPGNDSGDGSEFGVLIQTTLGKGGNWQFSNNGVYASGNIDNSGDFFGYLQYTNGDQVNLTGYIAPALGLFQNSAGYYTGSYSGSQSGSLYSIVAADGEIFFTTGKTGPGGNDGGSGQFQYSYNNPILNEFVTSEINGTLIYGVINTNSASVAGIASGSIMGLYTNNGVSGPFTMTRSSQVFSEVPPVITIDLPPGLAVVQGSISTFRLGVSGSAPLSYQWYFNGNPVPDATTNTLVVSNITGSSEIYATVEDAVGEATSEVCVVTAETSVPPIASYAGIYVGNSADLTNGVSDSDGYNSGGFVVYVSTNGQMTVAGQDNGDGTGNNGNNFGFLFQTTLVNGGYFTYYNSYYTANGGIDSSGDFYASLNYPQANGGLGESVYLTGNLESPYGPFQNSDGLYTGTYSGANSGTLDVIFDANGDLSLVPLGASANGPYGNAGTGVFGQFSNSTQFSLTSSSGTIVSGTLNSGTFVINGNYTNSDNSHGSFTVSRSSRYIVPVPPVITTDLPQNLTLPLGNIVTFDVAAAGTAPLSYQWYFSPSGSGFNPIPGAYTNTLVVSNNLWTTTGTYYIYVTVANGAGETNSQTCTVNVVTETNVPTVTITSPKPGELWSNSTFIVTGTASDKLAVTDVVCVVDGTNYGTISTNNYNNWFVPVLLNPGSNTISAYAINEGPLQSKTSTVLMNYIVSAPMTVLTNGPGIISPNYNNVPLQLGKTYNMTATGDSHFMLTNWSSGLLGGGPFSVYTNKATVIFAMQSNLVMQANFHDTLAPYLKVTNATQGMVLWTNSSFTVMGVATDDQEVATVTYSLNGAATPLPINSDIATWQAPLTLIEGTNVFSVYAQATNGNLSVTDTVDIVYAVSNLMTVVTNGPGTIAPNYNNQNLRVGENYIMTATGASHFMLTNWFSGLVGGPLTLYTNKPTAIFNMQSNLVMQANFQDTLAPYLKVTNATQGMVLWTNSSFTVMGMATDDQEVATITYSLNGAATTLPIFSDIVAWQAPLSLAEGTNIFKIYAQATNGNLSVTDTVDIVYAVSNVLVVATNGPGTVAPNYNNQNLRVGENYMMTATGASHFMLTNWSSGLVGGPLSMYTNKPTAIFEMQSNLVMQANFHDTLPPFLKITNATLATVFWTNASYTVMGVTTDDQEVATVTYSLNGAATTLLINSDIATWQAPLSLVEGTNTFSAYAAATNGNISATNTIKIVRWPTITVFAIATNNVAYPQAQLSFDGSNYLVVYQEGPYNAASAAGQFVSTNGAPVGSPLPLNPAGKDAPPYIDFDGSNYLVAWADESDQQAGVPIRGVFVSPATQLPVGNVLTLSQSTNVGTLGSIVYGGGLYFLMWPDDRTSPSSLYGAMINTSGTNVSGDFAISANGTDGEFAGPQAAFDGTDFLAVWSSASGNMTISGQLVNASGPIGSPFVIYTNSGPVSVAAPSVVFNGTNYLVLFNIGITSSTASSSGFHILGRFVTTAGEVLTNQITMTADAGPQIIPGADFDGVNFLGAWNQGWNPFSLTTSGIINGRFFNAQASPATAEFPIFSARPAGFTWTWAPVYFDGSKFVLVGGLGKPVATPGVFTNGVIYGAFVSP